ncbi:MAG: hypothetical protein E7Z79_02215 [Methanobrevibacter thaueri]|jgi:C1A family cysteine protease/uncharacterized protein GlcG (DUF336 family)|uniref:Peptidase C1A papain C-terminal domain-containing protein n=1 Tax=Methanobrevibacter thaueri TaxID=190975 RepID=A0A8T3VF52_9EURY|nr:C1 family peptidase [Methanobrevibacter thaueri]MBE6501238.1 hypothetical protein [Methanobrevibacter thaueri]
MNYKKGLMVISILVCILFVISCVSASDDIAGDTNQTQSSEDEQIVLEQDSSDNESLTVANDEDVLGATSHIYFDASAKYDGDGSQSKPYKYYDTDRIAFGSTVHFKNGVYNVQSTLSISSSLSYKTTFIGEGQDTILKSSSSILGFKVRDNSNFVLQELTIDSARINNNGNLEAKNVLFRNADSKYSQIYSISTSVSPTVKLTNCNFQNNHATDLGGAVSLNKGTITIENCNFYNTRSDIFGGAIKLQRGTLTIKNSRFESTQSKHGGAIYAKDSTVNIIGTDFINCKAAVFGGAVACENSPLTVDGCDFTNCRSQEDGGGAIYVMDGNSNVKNSYFTNDSAYFGGAICNLNSRLNVSFNEFSDNYADYYGGSIYNMYGNVYMLENSFYNSRAKVSGGAIITRFSNSFIISSNNFIRTYAENGPVIFIDGDEDSITLENNNVYRDIYKFMAVYSGLLDGNKIVSQSNNLTFSISSDGNYLYAQSDDSSLSNPYVDLKVLCGGHNKINTILNNLNMIQFNITKIDSSVISDSIEIFLLDEVGNRISLGSYELENIDYLNANLFNISFNDYLLKMDYETLYSHHHFAEVPLFNFTAPVAPGSLPKSYDSRDYGYITPVKDQGTGGNCWAFGGVATLEACLKKATGITFDFSEENIKNLMAEYSMFGWDPNGGGYDALVWAYLASWFGPVYDGDDIYDEYSALSVIYNPALHIQDILSLPDVVSSSSDFPNARNKVKEAIMEYGAVTMSTSWTSTENHCMSIVGWDDNYKGYDYFGSYTQGAWIVKNSYGPDWEYNGYLYISYYRTIYDLYTFIFAPIAKEYSDIYQYDYGGYSKYFGIPNQPNYFKNKFTSRESDILSAVSTYFQSNTDYTIRVYINGVLNSTQSGNGHTGYNIIHLDNEVQLAKGDVFEIEFETQNSFIPVYSANYNNKETFSSGLSFYKTFAGGNWIDLYSSTTPRVACIKAFTRPAHLEEFEVNFRNIFPTVPLGTDIPFTVTLPGNVHGLVTFTINGQNYYVEAVDGKATLNIAFTKTGQYTISVHYESSLAESNNISFRFSVVDASVQSVISIKTDDVVKYYGGFGNFNATLTDYFGIPLAGKTLTVKVNGKTYTPKTDADGEISIDLNLNPGIYTVYTYYGNKVETSKFIVKSTIGAVDTSGEFLNTFVNATFMDSNGQFLQGGNAIFHVDGKEFIGAINGSGFSLIELDLDAGNYTMTITNPVTGEQTVRNLFIDKTTPGFFTISIYQYGHLVSIYADLPFNANGYVTLQCEEFQSTYSPINKSGYTTLKMNNLPVGNHVLTAYYEGDDNYMGVYNINRNFTVYETNIEITSYDSSFYYDYLNPGIYTVHVRNNGLPVQNGDVVITIDGHTRSAPCRDGIAYIRIFEKPGIYQAVLEYGGVNITHEIHVKPTIIADATFNCNYSQSAVSATFIDAHGNYIQNRDVTFYVGADEYHGTTDANGYMTMNVAASAGSHEVVFINPVTMDEFRSVLNVSKITPQLDYRIKENSDSYSFAGILSQAATGGTLVYTFEGKEYLIKYARGFADFKITPVREGDFSIGVRFTGDHNLEPVSGSFIVHMNNKADVFTVSGLTVNYGQNGRVAITLSDASGRLKANSRITVVVDGKTSYLTTNSYGMAYYTVNLNAGTHSLKLTSNNNGNKAVNLVVKKSTPVLTLPKKTFKVKVKTKKYTVTFKLFNKNLKNYKLTLKVKGKKYNAVTNAKGQATFKITKLNKKGTFKAVVTFGGDGNLNKVSKSVKIKVK